MFQVLFSLHTSIFKSNKWNLKVNRQVKNKIAKPGKSTLKLYFNSMNEIMNEVNKYNFQLNNSLKSHP